MLAASKMWLKIVLILSLTEFCWLAKLDYEYEEINLHCSFEKMNEG